jgi:peptide/nickel transport system permease protein
VISILQGWRSIFYPERTAIVIRYIIKRLVYLIPVLFFITIIVFSFIHLIPGDPVRMIYGVRATEEKLAVVRAQLHLDKPVYVQYILWLSNVLRGDFGKSLRSNEPVFPIIVQKLGPTLVLSLFSMIISVSISIVLGVLAASRRNTFTDFGIMGFAVLGISIPVFWSGLLMIMLFSLVLRWFPSMGYVGLFENPLQFLRHIILPAVTLGFALAGYTTRMTRSQMLDVLSQDYIRTARAKGVTEKLVIYKHALRNGLLPIVTAIGLQFGFLMGGQILIEEIFAWPGIGRLAVKAIFNRDYTMVQGVVLIVAVIFVIVNLLVDVLYAYLNPRIRYK